MPRIDSKKLAALFIWGAFTFASAVWSDTVKNPCTAGQTWNIQENVCIPAANAGLNTTVAVGANAGVSDAAKILTPLPGTNTVIGPLVPANSPNDTTPSTAAGSSTLGSPGEPGMTTPNSTVPNMQVYGPNGSLLTGSRPINTVAVLPTALPVVSASVAGNATVTAPTSVPTVTTVAVSPSPSPSASASPVGQSSAVPTTTGASANTMGATPPPPGTLTSSNTGVNS